MTDTPRLAGAPMAEDDLPFLIEMYQQERVMTYLGGVRDAAYARKRLDGWLRHWDEHGWGLWAVAAPAAAAATFRWE